MKNNDVVVDILLNEKEMDLVKNYAKKHSLSLEEAFKKALFNKVGDDMILSHTSALEALGLFSGYVDEDKIYVYSKNKYIDDGNVIYKNIDDFSNIDYVIKNNIKCTSINQTFNDMLKEPVDDHALIEALSNYYFEHNENWNDLIINDDNLDRFNYLKELAENYYNTN